MRRPRAVTAVARAHPPACRIAPSGFRGRRAVHFTSVAPRKPPVSRPSRAQNPAAFPQAATVWLARTYPSPVLGGLLEHARVAATIDGDQRHTQRELRRHAGGIVNALRRLQPHLESFVGLWGEDEDLNRLWKSSARVLERLDRSGSAGGRRPGRPRSRAPRIVEAARRYAARHGLPAPGMAATFLIAVAVGAEPPCPTVDSYRRRLEAWRKQARATPRAPRRK